MHTPGGRSSRKRTKMGADRGRTEASAGRSVREIVSVTDIRAVCIRMRMITKDDVATALERIRPHVHRTPVLTSSRLGDRAGGLHLGFKCESFQRTGSFKARGALNAMMQLSPAERRK